jgi:signal transduction histidine kinase/DNA-binding response OmpR family regulator
VSGDEKANILLVDDLPAHLLVLQTVLEGLGQNLITARSGEEALRNVLEHDFAVILLDINMPGMDGLETAEYIRRRKLSAHVPIIFVTAYADEVHTARGYSLGAVDYIFAPVVPEVLRTKVQVFVDLYLMTQQVRRQAEEQVALAREQAARAAAEDATRRFAFLAEASTALSSTFDYGANLAVLARHVVPALADLGAVSRVDEQGRLGPAELAWTGGDGAACSMMAEAGSGPLAGLSDAINGCLKLGQMVHLVNPGAWPALPTGGNGMPNGTAAASPDELRSVAVLPLTARGHTLGVLTLALGPSGRSHGAADLALAGDLAARAAIALDNARLYQNIQHEDQRKNEFLAMLAHELRNPLAPIRNAVGVLKAIGSDEPNLAKVRDMIDRQVTHMVRLVDDLLDMSRLARGKILLRHERLDLTSLVRDTVEDYRSLLVENKLGLEARLPDEPLGISGDGTRLAQVLGNVLHNASKFTAAGGSVTVELRAESDVAVLSVRDTGIGIEPHMLERVFETFSQADSSLDRSRGGLGLGLSLVRGLVELHGGTVQAASAGLGQGTEITLRLPLAESPPPPERRVVVAVDETSAQRVLLIEDNADTAESMRILFSLTGHQIQVAHTGLAGLEAVRSFRPEVVLCDIGLPGGMDGYAVARAIRHDASLREVRLIALSGYGQDEDRRRSREAGFDAHLIKPVDFLDLRRLLSQPELSRPELS